jgi:translation initiation factor 1
MPALCKCGNPISGNNCSVCALPPDLCVCKTLEQQAQKIKIFVEMRKFGKPTTIIEGVTGNVKELLKHLKSKLACGGTYKNDQIELQGDHRAKLTDILVKLGYNQEQIEVS